MRRDQRRGGALVQRLRPRSRARRARRVSATNRSPGRSVRVSIETPVAAQSPRRRAARRRARPRRRSRARSCHPPVERGDRDAGLFDVVEGIDGRRRRSARSRAPCRRSAARRPARARRRRAGSPRPGRRPRSRRGSPRRTAARIVGGILAAGVVVGDDDHVGMLAPPPAPISGRLPRSRSPPAPKTTTSRPMHMRPQRRAARSRARRACGRSRRRPRRRCRGVAASCIRPRTVVEPRQRREDVRRARRRRRWPGPAATSTFSAWKPPIRSSRTCRAAPFQAKRRSCPVASKRWPRMRSVAPSAAAHGQHLLPARRAAMLGHRRRRAGRRG